MGQKELYADPDEFTKEVEGTIEDLFSPRKRIEIDPLTNEIRELADPGARQEGQVEDTSGMGLVLELEGEGEGQAEVGAQSLEEMFDEFQQALLTLEWEVTADNVSLVRRCLENVWSVMTVEQGHPLHGVVELMEEILAQMAQEPGTVPTSGPRALQKGFGALRFFVENPEEAGELTGLIDAAALELDQVVAGGAGDGTPGESEEAAEALLDAMEFQLESESAPMPDMAGTAAVPQAAEPASGPAAQFLSATSQVASPPPLFREVDPENALMPQVVEGGEDLSPSHTAAVAEVLSSHTEVLDRWIGRLLPVERLLATRPGMEKLHEFHRRLRQELEEERARLARALAGGPVPVLSMPPQEERMIETSDPAGRLTGDGFCPWKQVSLATWEGRTVALVPEEIAYEGRLPWWGRSRIRKMHTLPLRSLKNWPWSRLRPMLKGSLAELDESALKGLAFPVVDPPDLSSPAEEVKNPVILVLYNKDKGVVLLLDQPTTSCTLPEDGRWVPSKTGEPGWAGCLEADGEVTPVATVESLF